MDKIREARLETVAQFLVLLAKENVPPHIQEVLCYGDAQLGVKPGALERAIAALPSCEGWQRIESALTALRVLVAEKEKATRLQIAWRELYPDDQFYVIPSTIETAFVRLIDSLLGPGENASYLLYEAMQMKDGGRISINGTTYQIRTVDDLEAYLRASPPER